MSAPSLHRESTDSLMIRVACRFSHCYSYSISTVMESEAGENDWQETDYIFYAVRPCLLYTHARESLLALC